MIGTFIYLVFPLFFFFLLRLGIYYPPIAEGWAIGCNISDVSAIEFQERMMSR